MRNKKVLILKKIKNRIPIFVGYFEKIAVYELPLWEKKSWAVALPGFGIIIGKGKFSTTKHTLRHEFGHILQAKKWGFLFFYIFVATLSVKSALNKKHYHQDTWTEWSANILSYEYLKKPDDWNFIFFYLYFKNESPYNLPKLKFIKSKISKLSC